MSEKPTNEVFQLADHLSADDTLQLVRRIRLGIADQQMMNNPLLDKESFDMFNTNLSALSSDANKEKQLKQDEKSAEVMMQMAKMASEKLANSMGIAVMQQGAPVDVVQHDLTGIEGTATPAPGELDADVAQVSYEEFSSTVGAEMERRRREGTTTEPTA